MWLIHEEDIMKDNIIAVSNSSYKKSGCVHCGCDFCPLSSGISTNDSNPVKCAECGAEFIILANGLKKSSLGFKSNEDDKDFSFPTLVKHPRIGFLKHKFVRPDVRPENGIGEFCTPRSVGYDLACFVKSKEAGARVVQMFEKVEFNHPDEACFKCHLDYRPSEPLWIQVKINYDLVGEDKAEVLTKVIGLDNIITEDKIELVNHIEKVYQKKLTR